LKEIYEEYGKDNTINMFSIGGYSLGSNTDDKSDIASFKFQYTLEWPHLYDTNGELMRDYGFSSYPSMALIKDGEMVYTHSGKLSYDELSEQINKHSEYVVDAKLLTNNHNTEPGYDTDFVLVVENTGSITDTFDIGVKRNDGGFTITIEEGYESVTIDKNMSKPVLINVKTSASSSGLLSSTIEVKSVGDGSQSVDIVLYVNTDYAFGNQTSIGDTVNAHYAGILASNGQLFDSSMESVWDNYDYFMEGTTSANRHTDSLQARNVGCNAEGDPSEYCEGSRQMILGFDQGMLGMYEGQTLAVRIPAVDAYGIDPNEHSLGGEDLIFSIRIVSVE